ncbi:MAG: M23 family metallopeptidase [Clostridiales bacterium]
MTDNKFFNQDPKNISKKKTLSQKLFGNHFPLSKKEKLSWTAALSTALILITVFAFTNQDLWHNNLDTGKNQEQILPNKIAEIDPYTTPIIEIEQADSKEPVQEEKPDPNKAKTTKGNQEKTGEKKQSDTAEKTLKAASAPKTWLPPALGSFQRTFGYDFDPTYQDYRFHGGLDIELPLGDLVFAIADGTISVAEDDKKWGGRIEINHGGGYSSIYLGITPAGIKPGQKVEGGETIATVGPVPQIEAGQKNHLHLEILQDGQKIDPCELIKFPVNN